MTALLKQHAVGNCVRRLRVDKRMSVRTLASHTGFSPSFISQVENGQASPSIRSMERIAETLGVTLGEFFAAAAEGDVDLIVRVPDRLRLTSGWSHGQVEALGPVTGGRQFEPVLITLDPGGRSGKHPYVHATEEFALVLEGEVSLTIGPQEHILQPGDAVTVRAEELRLWQNKGSAPARFLIVSSRFSLSRQGRTAGGNNRLASRRTGGRSTGGGPQKRPTKGRRRLR
jgi:uncharacterized cupin superfamily protein/DNA-binding XRE family transcriptional regulator